jgi:5'-3' exonuclease
VGEDGFKERYYGYKMGIKAEDLPEFIPKIKKAYIEGLEWVF